MILRISSIIFIALLSGYAAIACSIPNEFPSQFDRTEYLFTGEVTGYVDGIPIVGPSVNTEIYGKFSDRASGIIVTVKQSFYSPEPIRKSYELFRYGLGVSCEHTGMGIDWVKEHYKIGQQVWVAAGRATHVPASKEVDSERLEFRFGTYDTILVSPDPQDDSFSDISSIFDYKRNRRDLIGNPYFELLKDLRRLDVARSQPERNPILDRLTFYSGGGRNCIFVLNELFRRFTSSNEQFDRYSKLFRERCMTDAEYRDFRDRLSTKFH